MPSFILGFMRFNVQDTAYCVPDQKNIFFVGLKFDAGVGSGRRLRCLVFYGFGFSTALQNVFPSAFCNFHVLSSVKAPMYFRCQDSLYTTHTVLRTLALYVIKRHHLSFHHLVLRLRTRGATPPLPNTISWRGAYVDTYVNPQLLFYFSM
jgi:hypothetical protein